MAAPLPPLQAAPVQAGGSLAAPVGGNASGMQSREYRGVRAEKEDPSQGGSPQEAAEGQKEGAGAGGQEQ